ncbi:MAG: helix-hairpin-helix domain-containing protein [Verrucomicrobiota bacterium]
MASKFFNLFAKKKEEGQNPSSGVKPIKPPELKPPPAATNVSGPAPGANFKVPPKVQPAPLPQGLAPAKPPFPSGKKRITQRISVPGASSSEAAAAHTPIVSSDAGLARTQNVDLNSMGTVELPLAVVLPLISQSVLTSDVNSLLSSEAANYNLKLPLQSIIPMMPSGKIEFTHREISEGMPPNILVATEQMGEVAEEMISLPLSEVVMRVPPQYLSLRADQKMVDPSVSSMEDPFSEEKLRQMAEERAAAKAAGQVEELDGIQDSPTQRIPEGVLDEPKEAVEEKGIDETQDLSNPDAVLDEDVPSLESSLIPDSEDLTGAEETAAASEPEPAVVATGLTSFDIPKLDVEDKTTKIELGAASDLSSDNQFEQEADEALSAFSVSDKQEELEEEVNEGPSEPDLSFAKSDEFKAFLQSEENESSQADESTDQDEVQEPEVDELQTKAIKLAPSVPEMPGSPTTEEIPEDSISGVSASEGMEEELQEVGTSGQEIPIQRPTSKLDVTEIMKPEVSEEEGDRQELSEEIAGIESIAVPEAVTPSQDDEVLSSFPSVTPAEKIELEEAVSSSEPADPPAVVPMPKPIDIEKVVEESPVTKAISQTSRSKPIESEESVSAFKAMAKKLPPIKEPEKTLGDLSSIKPPPLVPPASHEKDQRPFDPLEEETAKVPIGEKSKFATESISRKTSSFKIPAQTSLLETAHQQTETAEASIIPTPRGSSLDLNNCSLNDLTEIEGCSESIAKKIIAWRELNDRFKHPSQLMEVPGMTRDLYCGITGLSLPELTISSAVNEMLGLDPYKRISLQDLASCIRSWPGVVGCVISGKNSAPTVYDYPDEASAKSLGSIAAKLLDSTRDMMTNFGLQKAQELFLPSEGLSYFLFSRGDLLIVAVHESNQLPSLYSDIIRSILKELLDNNKHLEGSR